jgi:hypothetical protein
MAYFDKTERLPPLGALCLDYTEDIHRPPGDVIESSSYHFPIIKQKVEGASLWNVVQSDEFSDDYLQLFVDACNLLKNKGCIGIITSCGFLAQIQNKISSKIDLPIATSSLLQIPYVLSIISPNKKVAVLTFDTNKLNKIHFKGVGISDQMMERIIIDGCKVGEPLHNVIVRGEPYVAEEIKTELVTLATDLVLKNSNIGAFVLECTQMPPFSKAIQQAVHLPVFDGVTLVDWFYSGLYCRNIPEDLNKEYGLRKRLRSDKEKN